MKYLILALVLIIGMCIGLGWGTYDQLHNCKAYGQVLHLPDLGCK